MGPLAAIGDSFWWGTFRLLAAGIGTSLTVEGNPLGLLLYVLVFNVPHYLARYYGLFIGYKVGASFLNKAMESGIMQKITYGASIVGLMSVGAMTATMVKFETPLEFNFGDASIKVQEVLDQIFPAILPLAVTFFVYYLLKKEVKIMYVILGLLAFGIVASLIGLM